MSRASSSRERGPMTPNTAYAVVTSSTTTRQPGATCRRSQSASRTGEAALVTSSHSSSRDAGHRHVGLVPAARVEDAGVDRRPHRPVDVGRADEVQQGQRRPGRARAACRTTSGRTARRPRGWRAAPRRPSRARAAGPSRRSPPGRPVRPRGGDVVRPLPAHLASRTTHQPPRAGRGRASSGTAGPSRARGSATARRSAGRAPRETRSRSQGVLVWNGANRRRSTQRQVLLRLPGHDPLARAPGRLHRPTRCPPS